MYADWIAEESQIDNCKITIAEELQIEKKKNFVNSLIQKFLKRMIGNLPRELKWLDMYLEGIIRKKKILNC